MGDLGLGASSAFLAKVPTMSFDFTQTPTYSDLDSTLLDGWVDAHYRFTERLSVRGLYRYVDYSDDAPYLYDTSGRNHIFGLSLGWAF